jgi:hypothetical protein
MSSLPSSFTDPSMIKKQAQNRLNQSMIPKPIPGSVPIPKIIPPMISTAMPSTRAIKDKTTQPPRAGMVMPPMIPLPSMFPSRMPPGPLGGGLPPGRMPMGGPGDFNRRFPERPFMLNPGHFRMFDHRFDDDRLRFNVFDFRREFDDDERRIFLPTILSFRGADVALVEHILGLAYDPAIAAEGLPGPTSHGIWEIGVDGRWYRVTQADEMLIQTIEARRGDPHQPVVI